jgi:hypothetical protein
MVSVSGILLLLSSIPWTGIDDTVAVQAAIDAGPKYVILDQQAGPWVVTPLKLHSDQTIVLCPGVVVEAKSGSFLGRNDSVFKADKQRGIDIVGYGATLRMHKADYLKEPYTPAQWRSGIALYESKNVGVYGLTIEETGGDGVYVGGGCANVRIDGVTCRNYYRNGISAIGCEKLLIVDCVLEKTNGTALHPPGYGLDFEPNDPTDKLVGIVVRNTVSRGFYDAINPGSFVVALTKLDGTSTPVGIKFENCRSENENVACKVYVSYPGDQATSVQGKLAFVDCTFVGGLQSNGQKQDTGILIAKDATGFPVTFTRCRFENLVADRPAEFPIGFRSRGIEASGNTGDVRFVDCTILDPLIRKPFHHYRKAPGTIANITGRLTINGAKINLTPDVLRWWMPAYEEN